MSAESFLLVEKGLVERDDRDLLSVVMLSVVIHVDRFVPMVTDFDGRGFRGSEGMFRARMFGEDEGRCNPVHQEYHLLVKDSRSVWKLTGIR